MEVGLQGLFSLTFFEYLKNHNIQFIKEVSNIFGGERFVFAFDTLELHNDSMVNVDWVVGSEREGGAVYFEVYEAIDSKTKLTSSTLLEVINIVGKINQEIQIFVGKDWRTKQLHCFSRRVVCFPNLQEAVEEGEEPDKVLEKFYFSNILEITTTFSAFSYILNQTLPVLKNGCGGKYSKIDWYSPDPYNFISSDLINFERRTQARRTNLYLEGEKERQEYQRKYEEGNRIFNFKTLEQYKELAKNLDISDLQSQMDYELSKFSNTSDRKLAEQRLKILTDLINVKKES